MNPENKALGWNCVYPFEGEANTAGTEGSNFLKEFFTPGWRNNIKAILLLLGGLLLLLLAEGTPALGGEGMPEKMLSKGSLSSRVVVSVVRYYQRVVSPVDGHRCRMLPSCSEYAIQAIRKHGLVLGVVLFADRLMREGEEIHRGLPVLTPKGLRYPDPLEASDFWIGRSHSEVHGLEKGLIPTFVTQE